MVVKTPLGRPRRRWKNTVKFNLKQNGMHFVVVAWLRIGQVADSSGHDDTCGFHKPRIHFLSG